MISQGRSPRVERPLRNGIHTPITINSNHTDPEEISNPLNFAEFPYSCPEVNVRRPAFSHEECEQTFAREEISALPEASSFLGGNNFAQVNNIWTHNNLAENGAQPYDLRFLWCGEDVNFHSFASLPVEPDFSDTSNLVHNVQEATCNYSMFSSHTSPNSLIRSNTSHRNQEFYNQTCNCLQHFTLPLSHFPYREDELYSAFETNCGNRLDLYPVSYQKEIATARNFAMSDSVHSNDYYGQVSHPLMQSIAELPNQTTSNMCINVVQQTYVNQYILPTHESLRRCNESENLKQSVSEESKCMYEYNDGILNRLSDVNANAGKNKSQWAAFRDVVIHPSLEISDNSTNTSEEKPLSSHEPLIATKESCGKITCTCEKAEVETCDPNFCKKLKSDIETTEGKTDKEVKKTIVPELVKAQVDAFIKSPKKAGSSQLITCPVCGQVLARHSTLKIHMRQHSGDRPFKCSSCSRTFTQRSLLDSHLRTHSGVRPYSCPRCRKTFVHSSALKTHKRRHTGERPHRCAVPGCGLAFADYSTLSKHSRVHTGERPYRCDICNRRFTQSGNMKKHKETVHNRSKYKTLQKRTAQDLA